MVKSGKTEIAKEKFYSAKNPIKLWDINVDDRVIQQSVKT